MSIGLRRLFIYLFAVAFVFNGALLHASIDLPAALSSHAHLGFAIASDHATHHHDAHTGQDEVFAVSDAHDDGLAHNHIDGGPKSCGMCAVATVMPDFGTNTVRFSYALISFHARPQGLIGHLVPLDPDIPKTIA